MPGDGVVIGRALSPAVTIIDIKDKRRKEELPIIHHLRLMLFSHLIFGKHLLTPGIDPMSSRKPYLNWST